MEDTILSATKKSAPSSQQRQVNADHLFFDIRGIVHKEFVPPGQTDNGKFYCQVLRRQGKCEVETAWDVEEPRLVVAL